MDNEPRPSRGQETRRVRKLAPKSVMSISLIMQGQKLSETFGVAQRAEMHGNFKVPTKSVREEVRPREA
jgi:hypothetical protein